MPQPHDRYVDAVALYRSPGGDVQVVRTRPKRTRPGSTTPIVDCRPKPAKVQRAQRLDARYEWLGHVFANAGDWLVWDARGVSSVMTDEEFRAAFDLL